MLRYCAQRDPSLVWDQADKLPWDGTLAWQMGEQLWSVVWHTVILPDLNV